jgi:hypothetical protein
MAMPVAQLRAYGDIGRTFKPRQAPMRYTGGFPNAHCVNRA